MPSKLLRFFSKVKVLMWTLGLGVILSVWLVGLLSNTVLASSQQPSLKEISLAAPVLQTTATPTVTVQSTATLNSDPALTTYRFSLADLGYDQVTLSSPYGTARYSFRLPESWAIEADGMLNLDLSYLYNQVNQEEAPDFFGSLVVKLDGQTLETLDINEEEVDNFQVTVPLPASLLSDAERTQHVVEVVLDARFLCGVPHKATLLIEPTSSVSLNYSQRPLVPDLSQYPKPFYQQAFEPDSVRFVLPSQPTAGDANNVLAVAAKLGSLTNDRLVISATTDLQLNQVLTSDEVISDEHFIVIGQPENNALLPVLNDTATLPVSLHHQQLKLVMQGPETIRSGGSFTYVFIVTNPIEQPVELTIINKLSPYVEFVECEPDCTGRVEAETITWNDNRLGPNETLTLSLTVKVSDSPLGDLIENTVTFIDTNLGPVQAGTLNIPIETANSSNSEQQISATEDPGGYFFVYNGLAVSETDGIIQEIRSPWSENQAILVITGLNETAVQKASQAMSSEAQFPGMSGAVALVQETTPPSNIDNNLPTVEMTFADLGYQDEVVFGGGGVEQVDYGFEIPYGWELTDEAFVEISFSHSQLITYEDSGLTVLFNRQPIASIGFSEETAGQGQLRVNLDEAKIRPGQNNRLTIEVDAPLPGECAASKQAWVLIKDSSKIFLAHRQESELALDLEFFPNPFHLNPTLTNLLFALPPSPTIEEWEVALRLAASLGNSAAGRVISPKGTFADEIPEADLANYHLITIGRPSDNELIQQLNEDLPQPFRPGTDEIEQKLNDVVFRLPPGIDLGYVQLLVSPWNETYAVLVITGTTDRGEMWAARTLLERRGLLAGNLALIKDEVIHTVDTRQFTRSGAPFALATAVATVTGAQVETTVTPADTALSSTLTATNLAQSSPSTPSRESTTPRWLIPLIGLNGLIVIAIFAFVLWQARFKR